MKLTLPNQLIAMHNPADILEAARQIRPHLTQLLDADLAQVCDRQLATLLNQSDLADQAKAEQLIAVVDSYPSPKTWLDQFLNQPIQKGVLFQGLPGDPAPQSALLYVCPIGDDYSIYLEDTRDVPLCPTHLVPLVPAQS